MRFIVTACAAMLLSGCEAMPRIFKNPSGEWTHEMVEEVYGEPRDYQLRALRRYEGTNRITFFLMECREDRRPQSVDGHILIRLRPGVSLGAPGVLRYAFIQLDSGVEQKLKGFTDKDGYTVTVNFFPNAGWMNRFFEVLRESHTIRFGVQVGGGEYRKAAFDVPYSWDESFKDFYRRCIG